MSKNENKSMHRTTLRILELMETISEHPAACTLSDLSNTLNIPKSTLSPILYTLTQKEYLTLDVQQRYSVGLAAYQLGQSFLGQFHFLTEAERLISAITAVCMETCHFAVLSGGDVLYLKKIDSPQPIRMVSSVGTRLPAYATALGKSLLLDMNLSSLKALYPDGLKRITPNTITDFNELYAQLEQARREGFTYECEESNEYVRCIGIPVRKNGQVIAAISVATPVFRYDEEKADLIRALLKDAQKKIEHLLSSLDISVDQLTVM